jgi:hypothetical protein
VTVDFPSGDPSNVGGASKTNNTSISYTPFGQSSVVKNADATHILPAPVNNTVVTKTADASGYVSG